MPTTPKTIEEEHKAILMTVGYALSRFSRIENWLSILFAEVSTIKSEQMAHVIMSSIVSVDARLLVCHNTMLRSGVLKRHINLWTPLYNAISRAAKKRNELAHFSVTMLTYRGKPSVMLDPYGSPGKFFQGKHNYLSLAEVTERAKHFDDLGDVIQWLSHDVAAWKGKRPKVHEPMPDLARQLLQGQKTNDQKNAKKKPPRRSSRASPRSQK